MFIRVLAFSHSHFLPFIRSFIKNPAGATAIEYGLIAGGISLVIIAAVFAIGSDLKSMFTFMDTKMSSAASNVK